MFTKKLQDLKTMRKDMETEANDKYEQVRKLEAEISKLDIVMELLQNTIDEMELEVEIEPLEFE